MSEGLTSALSNKGSWEVQSLLRAWRSAITRCLAKCAGCRRCAFVSISVEAKDCSWFASCGGTRLQVHGFKTGAFERRRRL